MSLETGMCQQFNTTPIGNEDSSFLYLDEGIPELSDISYISSQDVQNIASYGNGPMSLFSGMDTSLVFGEDGTLEKSRKTSLFSAGSELMEINEISWLSGQDSFGNDFNYGYEQFTTLNDASFPFAVLREDLTKVSGTSMNLDESTSMTYLLLYDDFSANYDTSALQMAFGNSSEMMIKTFKYDPAMSNLSTNLGFDLSLYFSSDIWAQFGDIFNNQEIMALFHQMALDQQAAKNNQNDDDNPLGPRRNWWEDSEGGVYCKWGAVP